jgi:hypothetical protein
MPFVLDEANVKGLENWKRREAIVNYCVDVVNSSIDGKEGALQSTSDHQTAKNIQGEIYAERVKVCLIQPLMGLT